jgi:hypothetical protein
MGLLLILPGAILTQIRGMVSYGFRIGETVSPFEGMLRALIALFLIPSTQLIVSYSIDVGNSMTHVVSAYGIDPRAIMNYANAELYDVPFANAANQLAPQWENAVTRDSALEDKVIFDLNAIFNTILSAIGKIGAWLGGLFGLDFGGGASGASPSGATSVGGVPASNTPNPLARGKATAAPEEESQLETQSRMTTQMQLAFNTMNMVDCSIISVLLQFQTVMMCYLMLLGPIAAAFYAWPPQGNSRGGGTDGPFRNAIVTWINGVVTLAMWRFWWCMILLCMNVRIYWLSDIKDYHINSAWEMLVFSAFTLLMTAVPFQPFVFRPGELAREVLDRASKESEKKAEAKMKAMRG